MSTGVAEVAPEAPRVLFARQAIVARGGRLAGYELLYRGPRGADGEIPDAEHATCQVPMSRGWPSTMPATTPQCGI